MQSFAVKENYLQEKDLEIFTKIGFIFKKLPERGFNSKVGRVDITCHHLAHALAQTFPEFKAVDGYFGTKEYEHSRLEEIIPEEEKHNTRNKFGHTIIDPYPRGGIQPQMYYVFRGSPWRDLYNPYTPEERKTIHLGLLVIPTFQTQVQVIKRDIQKILNRV